MSLRQRPYRSVGSSGASTKVGTIVSALIARRELVSLGRKPRHVSNGRRTAILRYIAEGRNTIERWHVLTDHGMGKQLKRVAMTRLEAYRRNKSLEGTGFSWGLVG